MNGMVILIILLKINVFIMDFDGFIIILLEIEMSVFVLYYYVIYLDGVPPFL